MKSFKLMVGFLTLASLAGCNTLSQREDGLPELPKFLMHKAVGTSYYVDTLYQSRGNAYCVLQNPDYGQRILYDNDKIYASSPLMNIDSVSGSTYRISMLWRSADVDFANPATLQLADTVVPRYAEFERIVKGYSIAHPLYAMYGYTVDVPDRDVPDREPLELWLAKQLGSKAPDGNKVDFKEIGEACSQKFFNAISEDGDEAPEQSADLYSADFTSVYCYVPGKYVTYLCYNYGFVGGAHGMYNIRMATYSFESRQGVTLSNLFKPDSESAIRDLIYQSMASDPTYAAAHNVSTVEGVKAELKAMNIDELPLPEPALMPEGIVFCYQPYEIGPYSDGAYQFIVPWSAAADYLIR